MIYLISAGSLSPVLIKKFIPFSGGNLSEERFSPTPPSKDF